MNYRHAFHAGNFADLVKHGAITLIMDRLVTLSEPLLVVDSHAGAGLYDLDGEMARKSGEADGGVLRLMADDAAPEAFRPLKAAVRNANRDGVIRTYPGSPVLVADRLQGHAFEPGHGAAPFGHPRTARLCSAAYMNIAVAQTRRFTPNLALALNAAAGR